MTQKILLRLFYTTIIFIFFTVQSVVAQPGCPAVNAGPDQNLGCNAGCAHLDATYIATGTTTNYTCTSIPYTPPYPYNTGTPILVNIDDVWSNAIPLPFNFCYYGTNYNQIVVGSNGCITFDMSNAGGYCPWSYTATCPSSSLILNCIFGPYQDINPALGGSMYYAILGTWPCRTFVVNYYQIPEFSCTTLINTNQIVLYESTNVIEVYMQNKPLCSTWNSGNALVGIQNATGTVGCVAPGRNTSQWSATNEAWRFTPTGTPNVTIEWLDQNLSSIGTTDTLTVCPTANTTYTAVATYTNCNGNVITVTDQVTINVAGGFSMTANPADTAICIGESVTLNGTGNPAWNYSWAPSTGLSTTTGQTTVATPATTTVYTVTAIDPVNNCTASQTATVNVNPLPIISFNPANPGICYGQSIQVTASGADTYGWAPPAGLSAVVGPTVTAGPTTTTTYTVTATDSNQCTNTNSVTVNVAPLPNVVINASKPEICRGDTVLLTCWANGNIVWTPPTGLSTTTGSTVVASPLSTVHYTVTVDNGGCMGTDDFNLVVNPLPSIDFNADKTEGCEPLIVHFSDNTTPAVLSWNWNFGQPPGSNTTSHLQNPIHAFPFAGKYDITLSVISVDGCYISQTLPQYITVYPTPVAEFTSVPTVISILDSTVWFSDQSVGASKWQWDFGDYYMDGNASDIPSPIHTYSDTGTFLVTQIVTSEFGCTDTAMKNILVEPNIALFVPNAFTPNHDGRNDKFFVLGDGIMESDFKLRIFDRLGRLVFFTPNLHASWDGFVDGEKAMEGVYTWVIYYMDVKYNMHKIKGFVTLIY
ncbi:MAG: gliding motility-associated C-terminal domain-containing protein [Bacteroidota bacterium]